LVAPLTQPILANSTSEVPSGSATFAMMWSVVWC
jgi:hypothetical protein